MRPPRWIGRYGRHDDPLTGAANLLALAIAANQPFYPAMLGLATGHFIPQSLWTFLSTPGFLAVPALSRRRPVLGRSLLVLTGIANTLLCLALYGAESDVGLFLLPCILIAALFFAPNEAPARMALLGLSLASFLGFPHLAPAANPAIAPALYGGMRALHAGSVAMLTALIGLLSARLSQGAEHHPREGDAEGG